MFKKFRKVAARVATVALAFVLATTVAFAEDVTTKPGKSGSATVVSLKNIYGVDGTVTFSNPGIFESYSIEHTTGMTGEANTSAVFLYGSKEASGKVVVKYKIASNATPGDSCLVTFHYETSDANGDMSGWSDAHATITVGTKSSGGGSSSGGTTGGSTGVTTPSTVAPTTKSDLTELERLIALANKLEKSDYTAESWADLIAALNKAKSMTTSHSQEDVDAAAAALQAAIDGLVKIDYTELLAAIQSAKDLMGDTEFAQLWNELLSALDNANANLEGTSQAEVDAAAASLKAIVDKLNEILAGMETPVVTEPEEGVCTVPMHKLLVILLVVSVGLNLVFGFILMNNSKKRKQDNIPMVNH